MYKYAKFNIENYGEQVRALADHMGHSVVQLLKTYVNGTDMGKDQFYKKQDNLFN
jgi:hypothetical protein